MEGDPDFTLFWRDGKRQVLKAKGRTIAEAMNNSGMGGGILRALDFHAAGDCDDYDYDPKAREWNRKPDRPY